MFPKAPPVVGSDWITTPPLDRRTFLGRPSVLLFWSIGCEASRVRLLELDALHRRLPHSLNIVAVHSPRFAYERDLTAVTDMVARIALTTPVVHDPELLTWARYDPGGWPATVVIDPRGRALGVSLGLEGIESLIEAAELANLAAKDDAERTAGGSGRRLRLRPRPPAPSPLPEPVVPGPSPARSGLAWPSGLAVLPADTDGQERLVVADSGHDRLLVLALDNAQRRAHLTGGFDQLAGIQSICATSPTTIAASFPDRGKVLEVDLADGRLTTLADELERPTGLASDSDGSIVVADAGDNQLVRIVPGKAIGAVAGTGFLGTADGRSDRAELAQPVAVARTPSGVAFLDAATSNLRLLTDRGQVHTVTQNSFERFGLTDGPIHRASFQRPSALTRLSNGDLAIADTGNRRVRLVRNRRLRTLGLTGLGHPESLAVLQGDDETELLAVADTSNHRIVITRLDSREAWELELPTLD